MGRTCALNNAGHLASVCDRQEKAMETPEKAFLNEESAIPGPGAASKPTRAEGKRRSSCFGARSQVSGNAPRSISEAGVRSIPGGICNPTDHALHTVIVIFI